MIKQFFTNVWEKTCQFGRWCKKKVKEIAVVLGIIGIATAATVLAPPIIPSIDFNGEIISFPYTDDNTGENLIIRTDKQIYGGWNSAVVYVMVENISGENQETKIKFIDPKQSEFLFEIGRLEKDVEYQVEIDDFTTVYYDCSYYSTTTEEWIDKTCERQEKTGSHFETRYKDEWQGLTDIDNEAEFVLPKDKTVYFKTKIQFPRNTQDEFFIEITGDKGGYGYLDPWYNSSWTYRRQIDIDPSKVDDVLTNFPVMVKFSSSTITMSNFKDLGEDVRFTQSDGNTLIDYEIERWASTTDGVIVWVEIPSVASSSAATTTFYMYYGNAAASDAASSTAVWDSNFVAVYHMPDLTASTIDDSTGVNDGTEAGNPAEINGKIGIAQDFDGDDYFTVADHATLDITTAITLEVWAKGDDLADASSIIMKGYDGSEVPYRFDVDGGARMLFLLTPGGWKIAESTTTLSTSTWYHITGTYDKNLIKIYVDGILSATTSETASLELNNASVYIGTYWNDGSGASYWDGIIDEARISNTDRNTAWIKASYNSGNNSLLTIGAEGTEEVAAVEYKMQVDIIGG